MKLSGLILLLLTVPLLSVGLAAEQRLIIDDFENGLTRWEKENFRGENRFKLVADDENNQVLQVSSNSSATALIQKINFQPTDYPVLRWRWKISGTISSGDVRFKEKDDYPARVYVIFPHFFKPLTRTLNYIWANRLPIGEFVPSPYFSRSMMYAVESGNTRAGQWVTIERNLLDDYRQVFG